MAVKFLNDVTVDSSVLYVDTTNDRVGINQTSPIGAVHILGPNTNPAMTTSALVVEQGDGAKILIDGNDIEIDVSPKTRGLLGVGFLGL